MPKIAIIAFKHAEPLNHLPISESNIIKTVVVFFIKKELKLCVSNIHFTISMKLLIR